MRNIMVKDLLTLCQQGSLGCRDLGKPTSSPNTTQLTRQLSKRNVLPINGTSDTTELIIIIIIGGVAQLRHHVRDGNVQRYFVLGKQGIDCHCLGNACDPKGGISVDK